MEQPRQSRFTADEFIIWAMEQPAGRFELDNGVVVAMTPERVSHGVAKLDVAIALRAAVKAAGLACQTFTDGMAVRVGDRTVYEPDALVRCGPPLPGEAVEIGDPVIVVEVVSPSSKGIDRGVKLARYFGIPSLRHYLIVDVEGRVVIHHRRGEDGEIMARILSGGRLSLDPPGIAVEVGDVFAGLRE